MRRLALIILFFPFIVNGQTYKVLFLGNSYTASNGLTQMIAALAAANGDSLIWEEYSPGGYALQNHASDPAAIAKINQDNWDYVVLQDQSQRPALSPAYVNANVYPYAIQLDQTIRQNDSCSETVFFMTWGRKYGDQQNCATYPPVCTFEGMQQRLRESYVKMADTVEGLVAPAGAAWKNLRAIDSTIDLYDSDNSHPSIQGTYLTACTFYATIWRKSPAGLSYPAQIQPQVAALLQNVAASTVLDSLSQWNIGLFDVRAGFGYAANSLQVGFTNLSQNGLWWEWSFGDGNYSTQQHPVHNYSSPGQYIVQLAAFSACSVDVATDTLNLVLMSSHASEDYRNKVFVFPVPAGSAEPITIEADCRITDIVIHSVNGSVVNCFRDIGRPSVSKRFLSDVQPGAYIMTVITEDGSRHQVKLSVY